MQFVYNDGGRSEEFKAIVASGMIKAIDECCELKDVKAVNIFMS